MELRVALLDQSRARAPRRIPHEDLVALLGVVRVTVRVRVTFRVRVRARV